MPDLTLGPSDDGREIEVGAGSRVVLRLPENPSTGYTWELDPIGGGAAALEADAFEPDGGLNAGRGGMHAFCLKLHAPGDAMLRLALRQPWNRQSMAATYAVTLRIVAP